MYETSDKTSQDKGVKIKVKVYDQDRNADDYVDAFALPVEMRPNTFNNRNQRQLLTLRSRTTLITELQIYCDRKKTAANKLN